MGKHFDPYQLAVRTFNLLLLYLSEYFAYLFEIQFAGRYAATPLAMSLLLHGTLLEVCQGLFTTYRTASLADWLADGMGIAVALLLAGLGRFLLARLGRKARSSRIAT